MRRGGGGGEGGVSGCYQNCTCMRAHTCETGVGAERVQCGNRNVVHFYNMGSDESAHTGAEVKPEIANDQTQQTSHITLQCTSQVSIPRYKLVVSDSKRMRFLLCLP